jgi:hypothetical protein
MVPLALQQQKGYFFWHCNAKGAKENSAAFLPMIIFKCKWQQ